MNDFWHGARVWSRSQLQWQAERRGLIKPLLVGPASRNLEIAKAITVDGNEAAAFVALKVSETIVIYPITPSSPMSELCDEWARHGKTNPGSVGAPPRLDYGPPGASGAGVRNELRLRINERADPARFEQFLKESQAQAESRYKVYQQLIGINVPFECQDGNGNDNYQNRHGDMDSQERVELS
ncbi:MAG: hypothetical protein DMF69_14370 [Acidobacteria bacterium]|nr:MAG: hypothetical protein DMF69_14370 [Acidobacteriota bacterium]